MNLNIILSSLFQASNCFLISAFNISSHFSFSAEFISTSGSIIGTNPASQIILANSNCCFTTSLIPSSFASYITDLIFVPNTCFSFASFNSSAKFGISFISLTPFFSSARPLSTFKNDTICFSFHK